MKYKKLLLNDEEIKNIQILIAQEIINLKAKQELIRDKSYIKNKIMKYQKIFDVLEYLEREENNEK